MSRTSKSPRKVLLTAWAVAQSTLARFSHKYSPKKFTQHQLFACLVLKSFLRTDYRGLAAHLKDCPSLCQAIELQQVPHFTTFQKAARRLLRSKPVGRLLGETVRRMMGRKRRVPLAAIDSTGMESRHCSRYFIRRRSREPNVWQTTQYTRYPKLSSSKFRVSGPGWPGSSVSEPPGIRWSGGSLRSTPATHSANLELLKLGLLVDCSSHVVLGYLTDQGPKPDIGDLGPTLGHASSGIRIEWLTADAGYDSESNHRLCRDRHGIRSLIPPKHGRPTHKPATGRYRRLMQTRFDKRRYGQRWQVETVVSMIKRRQGSATSGRSYWSRRRDLMLMTLPHNIMILFCEKVFYRAVLTPFFWVWNLNWLEPEPTSISEGSTTSSLGTPFLS